MAGQNAVIWCAGIPMKKKYPVMESPEGHSVLLQAMEKFHAACSAAFFYNKLTASPVIRENIITKSR